MENTQKNAGVRRRSNTKVRYMTQVGMLSAVATVLMLFEFPLPFVPDFYQRDPGASWYLCHGSSGRSDDRVY